MTTTLAAFQKSSISAEYLLWEMSGACVDTN